MWWAESSSLSEPRPLTYTHDQQKKHQNLVKGVKSFSLSEPGPLAYLGEASFLASLWIPWSWSNQNTTINRSFYILVHCNQFNLVSPTIGIFVNFRINCSPSWYITNALACATHLQWCSSKWGPPHPFYKMESFSKNIMSHTSRSHATPLSLAHAAHPL